MAAMITQARAVTPSALEAELAKLKEGVRAQLPPGVPLAIGGTALAQSAIEAKLARWLEAFEAVAAAKKGYQDAVAARLAITVEARTFEKSLKAVLKQYFGSESPVLEEFGIATDKPFVATREQRLLAAARRTQTRLARGTTGRSRKRLIALAGTPPASSPPSTLSEAVALVAHAPITDEEE
jgi:hypothetical protein